MIAIITQPIVAILLSVIALLAAALIIILLARPKVVELSDELPKGNITKYSVMKLQNEIAPYVYQKGNRIYLKVVKPKFK